MKNAIYWFRNDLRLHDQEVLNALFRKTDTLLPVYCFDNIFFTEHPLGFPRTDSFRAKFIIETVLQLKQKLQKLGSDLLVIRGDTASVLSELVRENDIDAVYAHREHAHDERQIETQIRNGLKVPLYLHEPNQIFALSDLPFKLQQLPDIFTKFRKLVESNLVSIDQVTTVKNLPPLPKNITPLKNISINSLNLKEKKFDSRSAMQFVGGEDEGLSRLYQYIWENQNIASYKQTRNGLLGKNYSSKFSPWLANGSLSVKKIISEINRFESEKLKNESTYWLKFELLWREYFRLIAQKYGNKIFLKGGIKNSNIRYAGNKNDFMSWTWGETGNDFVDANMKELIYSGYMSNRGRQNVACYLCKDLKVDWRWGAAWFESQLIDYDVYSNWGNWMYVAGVGNDPRENRYFNVSRQAQIYDKQGKYRQHWLS